METSLHRQLKARYGTEAGGRAEVTLLGYRIDAVCPEGMLVEVQSGPLGPLRGKLQRLLPSHRIHVVKPIVVGRRLIRRARRDGADLSARLSPKRGMTVDVFDDLVGLVRIFPHPNLCVEVLEVEIDEIRVPRRRRPGYSVADRSLRAVLGAATLRHASDLLSLLPEGLDRPFTTQDLSERIRRPLAFAQRVAYCLRLTGAVDTVGKSGNRRIYQARGADSYGRTGGVSA